MKPHPRPPTLRCAVRKSIKWGGAFLSPLLAATWIASVWWNLQVPVRPTLLVYLQSGWCIVSREPVPTGGVSYPLWVDRSSAPALHFSASISRTPSGWQVLIPLWPAVVAMGAATSIAWRLDTLARRRAMTHLCPKCGYDRTGLAPGAVCPECGASSPTA